MTRSRKSSAARAAGIRRDPPGGPSRAESGSILVILVVAVAVLSLSVGVAAQMWSVRWRRDNEEELIFRGRQYVDALLLYRKDHNGQFPGDLTDLMKLGPKQTRYIRKLFRDPVNPKGQWGLLYLMPGGQGIYDPVAAQKAKAQKADPSGNSDSTVMAGSGTPGVTPIMAMGDMNGAGVGGNIAPPMGAAGSDGAGGQPGGGLVNTGRNAAVGAAGRNPSTMGTMAGFAAMRAGTPGFGAGMGPGMSLPPPKPANGTFDDDNPSEPPIGWPIVGVISRAEGKIDDGTYKVYRGHDKVSEWQFHVFDNGVDVPGTQTGAMPGGTSLPFIGPGFGGTGSIFGIGDGAPGGRGRNPGGFSPVQGGRDRGRGGQGPGAQGPGAQGPGSNQGNGPGDPPP